MKILMIAICILMISSSTLAVEDTLIIESGAVWQHRNDAKIPPSTGTYFSFDEIDQGPFLHHRLEYIRKLSGNKSLRFLYAPFHLEYSGLLSNTLNYNGATYTAGQNIDVDYSFNSYRIGWVYQRTDRLSWGWTLKVRDANIRFKQGNVDRSYSNTGVVPLLYLSYTVPMRNGWKFYSDVDFAAAPQGRAIDLAIKFRKQISEDHFWGVGYRTLEGGADNSKVFTFSWFNYAVLEYGIRF